MSIDQTAQPTARYVVGDRVSRWPVSTDVAAERLGRVVNADEAFRRFGDQFARQMFDGMLTVDDCTVDVMDDMLARRCDQAMIKQALDHGIETVDEAPESLKALFRELDEVPDWVDWDQLYRGAIAYYRAGLLVPLAFNCAVVAGSQSVYGATRPLVFTGRFDQKQKIRSAETFRWLMAVTVPGGMRRFEDGFKLTVRVRMLHAAVRRAMSRSQRWDWDDYGIPCSDTDGAYSISYSFSAAHIEALQQIGVRLSAQERADIYALMRYIGHIMGVPASLLHTDEPSAQRINQMYQLVDLGPDDGCRELVHSHIRMASPEEGAESEVFPTIVGKVMTPQRMRALMYGLVRFWKGDEWSDEMLIPDTRWKYTGYALKPLVTVKELARQVLPHDDEKAARKTIAMLSKSLESAPDETAIAPSDEVVDAIDSNASWFRKPAGRRVRAR